MDFTTLQTNFTSWVEGLATDRDGLALDVEWGRQPQKIHTKPFILAYLGTIVPIGHDIKKYEYNDLTDELTETMYGVRRATFRLSFRNFDQRLGYSARYFAERFRSRVQSSVGINTLADPLGLVSTGELIETDYEWSGRMVNQVEMDVVLNMWFSIPETLYDGGYIRNANITGESPVITEYQNPVETNQEEPVIAEETLEIQVRT